MHQFTGLPAHGEAPCDDPLCDHPFPETVQPDPDVPFRADRETRTRLLETYLRAELARALRTSPERITADRPLSILGVGSMMGLELQRRMEEALGVPVGLSQVLTAQSLGDLGDYLAALYDVPSSAAA
ncbi:acyl carrier protein [Streptomyces chiangmaiensis]|uniref:Acyl carrier protein n=1 Tax=Streptomyces chiangmaiensis TaxID=766497 RepID=A0ABU7FK79_9ACTN|nr:acyl carrier protein [Streptomyces chiangmaiensis]MED7824228.1 acyl carrier protein [Streptomyces chiangmaiensis]